MIWNQETVQYMFGQLLILRGYNNRIAVPIGVLPPLVFGFRNWKRTQYLLGVDGLIAPQPDEARLVQGL
jgi:hypothetical protein